MMPFPSTQSHILNSVGMPLKEVKPPKEGKLERYRKAEIEKVEKSHLERQRISALLSSMDPKDVTIVVLNLSIFMKSRGVLFIPAEIGLTAFSVQKGIIDNYWALCDPFYIPLGYGFEVRSKAEELGLPFPPFSNKCQNYKKIINGLEKFLKKHQNPITKQTLVFCLSHEVVSFSLALDWLYDQCGKKHDIKLSLIGNIVRPLSDIGIMRRASRENIPWPILYSKYVNCDEFYILSSTQFDKVKVPHDQIVESNTNTGSSGYQSKESVDSFESDCSSFATYDRYFKVIQHVPLNIFGPDYQNRFKSPERGYNSGDQVESYCEAQELSFDSELGCLYHMYIEDREGTNLCPLHVTNRIAYCVLASLISHYGVDPVPGVNTYDRYNPKGEKARRVQLLKEWGIHPLACNVFEYNGKPPKECSTRISDKLHPNMPRPM